MARPRLPAGQKKDHCIAVSLTLQEYCVVKAVTERAGLSLSAFARNACLGQRIISREDHKARLEMLKTISEVKKLGGLLKLTISKEVVSKQEVIKILKDLDLVIKELKKAVDKL